MTKGNSVCSRNVISKEMLEEFAIEAIGTQVEEFLRRGGNKLLRKYLEEEVGGRRIDIAPEVARVEHRLKQIDETVNNLLDNITPTNRDFVDKRIKGLRREIRALASRRDELVLAAKSKLDLEELVGQIHEYMRDFKRVVGEGTIDEKRSFLRAFCQRIELSPENHQGRALFYAVPEPSALAKDSSLIMVAGVGFEPTTSGL